MMLRVLFTAFALAFSPGTWAAEDSSQVENSIDKISTNKTVQDTTLKIHSNEKADSSDTARAIRKIQAPGTNPPGEKADTTIPKSKADTVPKKTRKTEIKKDSLPGKKSFGQNPDSVQGKIKLDSAAPKPIKKPVTKSIDTTSRGNFGETKPKPEAEKIPSSKITPPDKVKKGAKPKIAEFADTLKIEPGKSSNPEAKKRIKEVPVPNTKKNTETQPQKLKKDSVKKPVEPTTSKKEREESKAKPRDTVQPNRQITDSGKIDKQPETKTIAKPAPEKKISKKIKTQDTISISGSTVTPKDTLASSQLITTRDSSINKSVKKEKDFLDDFAAVVSEDAPDVAWSISIGKILWAGIFLLAGWILLRYMTIILNNVAERWSKYRLTIKGIIPVVRILGWTIVIYLIIVGVLRPPAGSLLALTASASIAIGFAAQDIVKNIFGGIVILLDRPFIVGDKIQVGSNYGEVISIGLRTVRLVTADDSMIAVPNAEIMNQSVSNSNTGQPDCQVVAEFYLPPDVDMGFIKKIAFQGAALSRYVYLQKPIAVIFKSEIHMGRAVLKMRLKAYVFDHRFEFPFMSDLTELVLAEFKNQGITVSV